MRCRRGSPRGLDLPGSQCLSGVVCPSIAGGFEVKAKIALCMRLALAGVFLYAGLVKAGASQQFAVALLPFTFVPPDWTLPLAHGLACTEILAAI